MRPAPDNSLFEPAGVVGESGRKFLPGWWLSGLGALALALAGAATLLSRHWAAGPPQQYVTMPVSRGQVAPSVAASGTVNAETTVQVGTYVSGVIQDVYCDFNTTVRRGQLCAKIDPRLYQATVDQQVAILATAVAQREKDKANFAYMELVRDRNASLVKRRDVSQDAFELATSNYEQARAQIAMDEALIRQQVAALGVARVNLDYSNIVSPVDGTVVSRSVSQGQTVAASFQTPTLFVIATDLAKMQVDTYVSESDIDNIKPGAKALFTVSALPAMPFLGVVKQIRQAPQMVQNVVTYDVVIGVDNGALLLKPGMTAVAHIVTAEHNDVLRVPSAALRYAPEGPVAAASAADAARPHVWVLRDDRPQPVSVAIGLDDYINAEVTQGSLTLQDKVIVAEKKAGSAPGVP